MVFLRRRRRLGYLLSAAFCISLGSTALAEESSVRTVPMEEKESFTFYVKGHIDGYGTLEFMVDTGSGYVTINEQTLGVLKGRGKAEFVRQLEGVLADGSTMTVPIYRVESIDIGNACRVHDVEVAVLSGDTRCILGLSALRKTAPFVFSTEPPALQLSNCYDTAL